MHPPTAQVLAFVADRRVGRLATVDEHGAPSVVPFCYVMVDEATGPAIVSALDEKPKRVPVTELRRVKNILRNSRVSLVVDDYSEDWRRLGFVQLQGRASIVDPGAPGHADAIDQLRAKYPQYERMALERVPLIWIADLSASSWHASEQGGPASRPLDLLGLIQGRRSVRSLRPEPIARPLLEAAIAAAGWAPSPHGRQPWRFSVVESAARKERLVDAMATTWREQLELDGQDAATVQIRLQKSRGRLLEAPVIVVPCLYLDDLDVYPDHDRQLAERTMAEESLGAAIQNLLLSLYSTGLDAGWMCAPLFCPEVVARALQLDRSLIPRALIPVGYVANEPARRSRLPLDQLIVDWS